MSKTRSQYPDKSKEIRDNKEEPAKRAKKLVRRAGIIMGSVIIIFSAVSMSIVIILYSVAFPRYDRPAVSAELEYTDIAMLYPRENISFESRGNTLAGYLYGAEGCNGIVVLAHGMGRGADSYLAQIIYFVDRGWQVFAFDFTGSYESEGASVGGFAQGIYDVDSALDYIEAQPRFEGLPVVLFGHSWGGYSVCAVSAYEKHNIAAIASVSALDSSEEIVFHYTHRYIHAYTYTQLPFFWAYEGVAFGSAAGLTATDGINAADVPVMLIHSEDDEVVPFELSVIAHADELTNDRVTCEIVKRTHTGLLYAEDAENLRAQINSSDKAPSDSEALAANRVNTELMDKINNFFLSAIAD